MTYLYQNPVISLGSQAFPTFYVSHTLRQNDETKILLWVLKFLAHSLTKLVRHFVVPGLALEYHGNNFVNNVVTVGEKIEYKISNMFSDIWFDLFVVALA